MPAKKNATTKGRTPTINTTVLITIIDHIVLATWGIRDCTDHQFRASSENISYAISNLQKTYEARLVKSEA